MREESWRQAASSYGPWVTIAPRYADLDVQRHLNNVAVGALHQEARMRWLMSHLGPHHLQADAVRLSPRWMATDYLGEGQYPEDIAVGVRCLGAQPDGCDMSTAVYQQGRCFGTQQVHLAAWQDGAPVALPPAVLDTLAAQAQPPADPNWAPPSLASASTPSDFAWSVALQSRFGDMDADGLAGEMALTRYMETARILGMRDGIPALSQALHTSGMGLVVGRVELSVFQQRAPSRSWQAGVRVSRVGTASFTVQCALFSHEACVAVSDTVLVAIQSAAKRAAPLPPAARDALAQRLAAPQAA